MESSRILIVEDDEVVSDYLKLCLMLMGYTVVDVCSYGEDAVEKARALKPDLIMMDIKLQGAMSGVEAVQLINMHDDIPVVYLTGYGDDDILQSVKVTDPFGYLLKPFRESDLKSVLEIALYRHRMGKELKAREASYRILAESLPGIVYRYFLDDGAKIHYFNDMLEKMTGFKEEELAPGKFCPLDALLLPEDKPVVTAALSKAVVEVRQFEIEYRIRHKDGSIRYFLERGRALHPDNGDNAFIDSVILDISERRMAEDKLEQAYLKLMERQAFIESILTNIQSGLIVTDLDFRIKLMNPSAEKYLGMATESAIGNDINVVCPTFADAIRTGAECAEVHCTVCPKEHIVGFKLLDMKGKGEAVNGHIISFTDLTEIVKIRNEMKLKERLAVMGEFVARVAHEIRNPLFGMTAICQIFSMELQLNDAHQKLMDSMMKEAWRLKHLVEELLDCSRELKIVRKKCDLVKMVDECLFENSAFMKEKDVSVEKIFPDVELPLEVDSDKIKQVILNLLKNAIEASCRNDVISIFINNDPDNVTLGVSDVGAGIPVNVIDNIFDVFYTTKRHGTGLGLAISKNIIVAHGGSLLARNRPEGGATFVFTIPLSV